MGGNFRATMEGATRAVAGLARALDGSAEVRILPVLRRFERRNGLPFVEEPGPVALRVHASPLHGATAMMHLRGHVRHRLGHAALAATNAARMRHALHAFSPDVVHVHGLAPWTWAGTTVALARAVPTVVTLHGSVVDLAHGDRPFSARFEGRVLRDLAASGVQMICVSTGLRRRVCAAHSLDESAFAVVGNGVELPASVGATRAGDAQRPSVLLVGSLVPRKNQRLAIEAMAAMEPRGRPRLLLVGEGPDRPALEEAVRLGGLEDDVKLLGSLSDEALWELYAQAGAVLSLAEAEPFGLTILESLAAGTPVVTFDDLDAMDELFEPQVFELAAERTPSAVAAAVQRLLERQVDPGRARAVAAAFSWSNVAQDYMALYGKAVGAGSRPTPPSAP